VGIVAVRTGTGGNELQFLSPGRPLDHDDSTCNQADE